MNPVDALAALWTEAGCDPDSLATLQFEHAQRQLPSSFHVAAIAGATIGAQALAAAEIWRMRTGESQPIGIDMRHALAAFRSERYLSVDGKPPVDPWSPTSGYYQAGDGRWVQLHTNFPHHRDGVLRVLDCADSREAVAAAIARWNAAELDDRLNREGLCASLIRSPAEWRSHPQALALEALPLFEIERIGDAPPQPFRTMPAGIPLRPLSGVRVLDLSRVIAAPVAARTLAQHGADVLAVGAAHLPNIMPLVIDTGRGKRATQLDLRYAEGRMMLRELIRSADVFIQAYRPGALAAQGFSEVAINSMRPGLIQVSLSAYGHVGPWAQRRGYDSLVQSATGIAWQEGLFSGVAQPGKLPCQALDHATGYLAAFGAMAALQRRAIEGGSWLVRVSLAQTGRWLQAMGPVLADSPDSAQTELSAAEVDACRSEMASRYGLLSTISPVERMPASPPFYALPPPVLNAHPARWAS